MTRKPAAYKTLATSMTFSGHHAAQYSNQRMSGAEATQTACVSTGCDVSVHAFKPGERGGGAIQLLVRRRPTAERGGVKLRQLRLSDQMHGGFCR